MYHSVYRKKDKYLQMQLQVGHKMRLENIHWGRVPARLGQGVPSFGSSTHKKISKRRYILNSVNSMLVYTHKRTVCLWELQFTITLLGFEVQSSINSSYYKFCTYYCYHGYQLNVVKSILWLAITFGIRNVTGKWMGYTYLIYYVLRIRVLQHSSLLW